MDNIMDAIIAVNDWVNSIVWGVPVLLLILGTGIFFTVRMGFLQFRHPVLLFKETVVKAFRKKDSPDRQPGEVTSFQAAMTSVGAIVGSGNIAGIATAIVMGGPGGLVWTIVAEFVGMATKFAEIALGIRYREIHEDGSVSGGAMYYLAKGLKQKWLGILFSFLVIPYAFVISAVVDTNSIALTLNDRYAVPTWVTGLVLAVLTAIIIFGGVSRVGKASAVIAPFMGGMYVLAGVAVILFNLDKLPEAISTIFASAFNPSAMTGGAVGSIFICMRYGIARGIYSNEAGLGTAAMVHCSAKVDHPIEQAVWGPIEVFLDTVLVCTVTALTVVMSGLWQTGLDGSVLTMRAFEIMLPGSIGGWICTASIVLFGFTCLISFYTYAERASEYIFGPKSKVVVKVAWIFAIFIGSQTTLGVAWSLADTFNGLMIIPNLVGIILLSGEVVKLKKEYFDGRLH